MMNALVNPGAALGENLISVKSLQNILVNLLGKTIRHLRIRNIPHRSMSEKYHHQSAVPQHSDDKYKKEQNRNEISFRSFSIWNVFW